MGLAVPKGQLQSIRKRKEAMNLHEYQAKQLFREYGLPVSEGYAEELHRQQQKQADRIGGNKWVVKAQVHAGGRGKAGGVKLVSSKEEIRNFAQKLVGQTSGYVPN